MKNTNRTYSYRLGFGEGYNMGLLHGSIFSMVILFVIGVIVYAIK